MTHVPVKSLLAGWAHAVGPTLIHKLFRPYGWEGSFEFHTVETVRLKGTICYRIQPKLTAEVDVFNLATRELPSLVTLAVPSLQYKGGRSFADGQGSRRDQKIKRS